MAFSADGLAAEVVAAGVTPEMMVLFRNYIRTNGYASDPFYAAVRRHDRGGGVAVFARKDLLGDAAWYGSEVYRSFFKPCGLDHVLTSICRFSGEVKVDLFSVRRSAGEPPFSTRDKRLARLLHRELGRLIGPTLALVEEPGLRNLPPRLRQTLDGMARGWSEKHLAAQMGISPTTLHPYISQLYEHFAVSERVELMARYLGRNRLPGVTPPLSSESPPSPFPAGQ
jgi:hypothetical protein